MFDPGDSTGRLRACPFLRTLRALLCGELFVRALDVAGAGFRQNDDLGISFSHVRYKQIARITVDRCLSAAWLV